MWFSNFNINLLNTSIIFLLILFAAVCHAGWSTIVKYHNSLIIMAMTSIVEIIIFTPLVFYVPFPPLEVWYFIIASVILHGFYRLSVAYSYKFGDISFVYPIARGGSSILIATISLILLNDNITLLGFAGILIVCLGIFLISYNPIISFNRPAFILASSTAILITMYTLVDGIGVRLSENTFSYLFWLLLLNGIPVLIFTLIFKKNELVSYSKKFLFYGLASGLLAIISYGIVVWAMQYLAIAYVSSIREVSIILATLMGYYFLGEIRAKGRVIPAFLVFIGMVILYLQI